MKPETHNEQKRGKWDIFGATYYWYINLDPLHEQNTTDRLTGYSKKVGESENQDIDLLLRRKIVNLLTNGYFKRATSIEFFQRTEFVIDKKRDPKILILYPTHWDIPELNHDLIYKKHGAWLKELYDAIKYSRDVKNLLPVGRKPVNKDDFLNIHRKNLENVGQLYAYAANLSRHGHEPGAVNDFIYKYKALKGWK